MTILDSSRPATSILDYSPQQITSFLQHKLAQQPVEAAYIFGSFARGQAAAWSDLDVLIVMPTKLPFLERPRLFDDLWELGVALDLLVYTPQEFQQLRQQSQGFWREFNRHHMQII